MPTFSVSDPHAVASAPKETIKAEFHEVKGVCCPACNKNYDVKKRKDVGQNLNVRQMFFDTYSCGICECRFQKATPIVGVAVMSVIVAMLVSLPFIIF